MSSTTTTTSRDYETITARQQTTRVAGGFARVGSLGILHGELLCEAVDVHPGERVLDVAAGNGAASLAAARRWADVTATNCVDHLLVSAQRLAEAYGIPLNTQVAEAYGIPLNTQVADAHDLPFDDDTFDVVLSAFGTMFAPDQDRVADELVRVCRPRGRIGLVNWSPTSLIGDVFRTTGKHVPPPGLRPAIEWGKAERLHELFGNRISSLRVESRQFTFRYRSAGQVLEYFRSSYGPTRAAFESLDDNGKSRLAADLIDVYTAYNRADDGTFVAPSDYVEVVAVVR